MISQSTKRRCKDCGQEHEVYYVLYSKGVRHLAYRCEQSRKQHFVEFVAGLKIKEVETKKFQQEQAEKMVVPLFDLQ